MKPSMPVSIGIRSYELIFETPEGGRQVDHAMKKRRFVRRRLVTPKEQVEMLKSAASDEVVALSPELADMECAICADSFKDTPTVHVVKLAPCGHCFHGACVQHLADRRGTCPFCRGEVDWQAALAPKPVTVTLRSVPLEAVEAVETNSD